MLQIVEFNDDLEFGKIRKMDTEARKKERKKESKENRGEMDQSYDGLDRSIGTIGLADRIPTRPYECPTPAWQREKK